MDIEKGSLYVITDPKAQRGRSHLEVLTEAIRGGASMVQLRDKEADDGALIEAGKALRKICDQYHALFIVNDRMEVARTVGADGLHIGQDDISIAEARRRIGPEKLLGVSTHSLDQARRAAQEGADYIGLGPIFQTPTKPDYPPVGLELIRQVRKHLSIPLVAIGGIDALNIQTVMASGSDAVAVVRSVVAQDDIQTAAKTLCSLITSWKEGGKNKT
ncbi:MAG: thiamine phosphate synthase [Candidatus Omnitrophota bacterium]